ncbi:MAG: Maf family nucleotide pyrophosphatase [Planctomycetota bacterium]
MKPIIILASASTRRSQILSQCGIPHQIVASGIKEIMDSQKGPAYNTVFNACLKAETVSKQFKTGYVIGVDTIVLSGKRLIGKPRTKREAKNLLKEFSGKNIFVYTGICIKDVRKQKTVKSFVASKIRVKKIKNKMLNRFLKLSGPFDKAGGFSIEGVGAFIFDDIEGSFYNILGLPIIKLNELFERLGVNFLEYCDSKLTACN